MKALRHVSSTVQCHSVTKLIKKITVTAPLLQMYLYPIISEKESSQHISEIKS